MVYTARKTIDLSYDQAIVQVASRFKEEGFGVLTEIDIKCTLKKKLNGDFKKYKIPGACNPDFAHKALQAEEKIGVILHYNVIAGEHDDGEAEVSAVNPVASMQSVSSDNLQSVAGRSETTFKR